MTFLSYEKVEFFFSNFSFLCLFVSMVLFWFNLSGKMPQTQTQPSFSLQGTSLMENSLPAQVLPPGLVSRAPSLRAEALLRRSAGSRSAPFGGSEKPRPTPGSRSEGASSGNFENAKNLSWLEGKNWGEVGILSANLSLFALLSLRWLESGHFPLSNLYESLMFLTWALTFFHLCLQQFTGQSFGWLGAITAPTCLFTNAFSNFSLPVEMQRSSALVPALQSNWLMMHVTVMILSYAALIFGCLLSIGFLILTLSISSEDYENKISHNNGILDQPKIQWAQNLDNLSYRMLGIGFPLLTIGILSGAVWANEAWGSYWSWDPKETWALLTWLVFAIYLHTRITKNWQGKKPAMIASFGFFVVWICYLGVNLLGEGLHSYGWLSS